MPRIRSKQIIGDETPVNPTDLVNKKYVDDLIVSGGTGSSTLIIEDEYSQVLSGVTILNFVGVDVRAQSALSGTTRRVNVYIPPPAYVSHFNTTDGTTDAIVTPITTTTRYVALPDSEGTPYKIGDWVGGSTQPCIRNSSYILPYSTTELFSLYDLTTTFNVTVYDADGVSILATHTSPAIFENDTYTLNDITYIIQNFDVDADQYQANITIDVDIQSILPQGGRYSIKITHNNSADGVFIFLQNNVFRDVETFTSEIDGVLTILPQSPVVKQISGVYFYTLGSEWHVNLPTINDLNFNSYPTTPQLIINDNDLIFTSEVLNAHGEGGSYYTFEIGTWSRQYDTVGAEFDKLDWTTNETNETNWNHTIGTIDTPVATSTIYDWVLSDTENSTTYNYLIDTLVDSSDRNSEMFRTETNATHPRLQSDLVTPWDETANLAVIDSGTGLQIIGDRLVYPQYDFQPLNPNSGTTQPDYSGIAGDKFYYRDFETNGANVSNGVIELSDHNLVEADLVNIEFEISIDSGATWYTLATQYTGGLLYNGAGCRVDVLEYGLGVGTTNNSALKFSLGQLQASPPLGTSKFIQLKITFNNSASDKHIGGIDLIEGNWI